LGCGFIGLTTALFNAFVAENDRDEKSERDENDPDFPFELALLMARAIDLDELHQVGASFDYPNALDLEEWIALRELQRARRKIEANEIQKQKDDAEMKEREQRLKAMTGRT